MSNSLGQRTLLQIAASMGIVTPLATGITYLITFAAVEERSLGQLSQSVSAFA